MRIGLNLIIVLYAAVVAVAQNQSAKFEAATNLVTIQVSVLDNHGSPVTNARIEDFQVFENGKKDPEQIAYFQPVIAWTEQKDVKSSAAQNNKPESPRIRIPAILLMDVLNTDVADQMYARYSISRVLNSLPPDTRVAVMRLDVSLWLLQDFTCDRQALEYALRRATSTASMANLGAGSVNNAPAPPPTRQTGSNNPVDLASFVGGLHSASEKEFKSGMMDIRIKQTLASLEAIAKLVGHYRVRKNLIWVSGSFPLSVDADADADDNRVKFAGIRDYGEQTKNTANILADANIAIYPIDTRGLETPEAFSASYTPQFAGNGGIDTFSERKASKNEFADRVNRHATMSLLADETGGRPCLNNNDFGGCLIKDIADGSSYYEIGYYPHDRNWNGKFRYIKVKSTLRGVQLNYRDGYFAEKRGP